MNGEARDLSDLDTPITSDDLFELGPLVCGTRVDDVTRFEDSDETRTAFALVVFANDGCPAMSDQTNIAFAATVAAANQEGCVQIFKFIINYNFSPLYLTDAD